MAFSDDVFPFEDGCEICGVRLDDEVVIQEFADGSLARLCPDCAAGAALEPEPIVAPTSITDGGRAANTEPSPSTYFAPNKDASPTITDSDPAEMTKELLSPVTDLLALQTEMQTALERLAASLERFAGGVISESMDRSLAADNRIRDLERELEWTRTRLQQAESLQAPDSSPLSRSPVSAPPDGPPPALRQDMETQTPSSAPAGPPPGVAATTSPAPANGHGEAFSLEEIRWAQRVFNESAFTARVRDIRHSLGRPMANLFRVAGPEPRALVTIVWDIVWYQYLVNLRRDAPADQKVALFREGMDLDELAPHFREKNASIDDEGRLDASEREIQLLSDPSFLITNMSDEEERALEDATEEIWDQRVSPEFKWDD